MIFEFIRKFLHTVYDIPALIAFGGYFILFAIAELMKFILKRKMQ